MCVLASTDLTQLAGIVDHDSMSGANGNDAVSSY